MKTDRITGSLLGLALGDAFGAPYEGGLGEQAAWAILGKRRGMCRWTDDTQMTIDVAESLTAMGCVDQDDLARRFAASYEWSRGYGPGAAQTLKLIRRGRPWHEARFATFPGGSFGNGGAMRSAPVGLFFAGRGEDMIAEASGEVAGVTHAHPLGLEGAIMIALATALSYNDAPALEIIERLLGRAESPQAVSRLEKAGEWLRGEDAIDARTVAAELGNGVAAHESCATAVYAALAFRDRPFDELLEFAIGLGGDVDTIAAMACAIWGAGRGEDALPADRLEQLEQRDRIAELARSLSLAAGS